MNCHYMGKATIQESVIIHEVIRTDWRNSLQKQISILKSFIITMIFFLVIYNSKKHTIKHWLIQTSYFHYPQIFGKHLLLLGRPGKSDFACITYRWIISEVRTSDVTYLDSFPSLSKWIWTHIFHLMEL